MFSLIWINFEMQVLNKKFLV